jgi:hypothetical protein
VITCALTGVLTDPQQHHVPVTPEQMAQEARRARDAGASVVHIHFRSQEEGAGKYPSWDPKVAKDICDAIKAEVPDLILNLTTGVVGDDLSGPIACLEAVKPEMAALNAGSLNYLKLRSNNEWAWPPMLFDNPVAKIEAFEKVMKAHGITNPNAADFNVGSAATILDSLSSTLSLLTLFLSAIAGISLLVGGIGVMNIMLISVTERTNEIGVRKAIGARKSDIRVQFLLEAVVLTGIGGVIGVMIGGLYALIVRTLVPSVPAFVSPLWVTLGVGMSVGVGLFFGYYPANRAANLDPIVCLRDE